MYISGDPTISLLGLGWLSEEVSFVPGGRSLPPSLTPFALESEAIEGFQHFLVRAGNLHDAPMVPDSGG